MPRTRALDICETLPELQRLEATAIDDTVRARIATLRTIKQSPELTTIDIANAVGRPVRTVKRWLTTYRVGGLAKLLAIGSNTAAIADDVHDELRILLARGTFTTNTDVKRWLYETHGINVSLPTIAALIERCTPLQAKKGVASPQRDRHVSHRIADWHYAFCRALPERVEPRYWIEMFRTSLAELLAVDRVSVDLNIHALRQKPEAASHSIAIAESVEGDTGVRPRVRVHSIDGSLSRSAEIIERIVQSGLGRKDYHPPFAQEYHMSDGTYLGTIVLWQRRDRNDISELNRSTFIEIGPIVTRLMLDCAARHEGMQPANRQFYETLRRIVVDCKLTRAEERVITMRLLGHAYKEIADDLGMTIDNVGKHLTSVHRKTGTAGIAELNAKLFAPHRA